MSEYNRLKNYISTHSLTKRLTDCVYYSSGARTFQLTASRRGWLHTKWLDPKSVIFQLTASRRGWPVLNCSEYSRMSFQLTASRRGWQQFCTKIPSPKLFFCNYYIYCFLCSSLIQFFAYFFFLNLSFCRCECSRESCVLNFRTYNIKVSVTSKPGLAPICSTLFLYFSPR